MRTIAFALLLGTALTACGGNVAGPRAAAAIPAEQAPTAVAELAAIAPVADVVEAAAPMQDVAEEPTTTVDPGLVGEAKTWAAMTPQALDENVQGEVWRLYFDFEAKYSAVIDEMHAVLGTVDTNDTTESIIEDACASRPRAGAVADELASVITNDVGPILTRQHLDVDTLLEDMATYHQQVIALGVCG